MAGLFYIVRLFVYHTEAQERPEMERKVLSDQFEIMERKLMNIISTPAMLLTLIAGISMLCIQPVWLQQPWMHVKLAFVGGLVVYHFICIHKMKQMRQGIYTWTSTQLRIWNEVATIFLFAIVFLVVLKNALSWIFGVLGIIAFSMIIMSAVKIYRYYRLKGEKIDKK
jgi:putative membrane protein